MNFTERSGEEGFCIQDQVQVNIQAIMDHNEDGSRLTLTLSTLKTLLHELFHYWQFKTYGLAKVQGYNILFNGGAHFLYLQNPIEVEARSFAESALKQVFEERGSELVMFLGLKLNLE
jgi:hypothetical protein